MLVKHLPSSPNCSPDWLANTSLFGYNHILITNKSLMKQKIIKIGSSLGVVIPKPVAQERGFRVGDRVTIHPETDSNDIRISPAPPTINDKEGVVDPAILQWTNNFIAKNRELLNRLKDK